MNAKRTKWISAILMVLALAPFVLSGVMKLMVSPQVTQGFARAGIPQGTILPLGMVELACVAIYLFPRTMVLGSLVLTGYLGGVILANLIVHGDIVAPIGLGVMLWAAAWLRVPELRALLPVRPEWVGNTWREGQAGELV